MSRRIRIPTEELYRRAVAYVDRRGGALIRRGGRSGGGGWGKKGFDAGKMYGLSNFSAANFFQTQLGGGESGVASGFFRALLYRLDSLPVSGNTPSGKFTTGPSRGSLLEVNPTNVTAYFASGAGALVSAVHPLTASDVGKLYLVAAAHSGAFVQLWVPRRKSAESAITGYTDANVTVAETLGARVAGAAPCTSLSIVGDMTLRGVPSQTQIEALFDQTRILGDLPATFPLGSASDADIAALAPRHWYRMDTFTPNAGNLGALQNRNATVGGVLNVAAGTIALPAADAQFGGQPSIAFTGTQRLESSLPASEFRFLHQRCHIIMILAPDDFTNYRAFLTTQFQRTTANIGATIHYHLAANGLFFPISNGSSTILQATAGGSSGYGPPGVPDIFEASLDSAPDGFLVTGISGNRTGGPAYFSSPPPNVDPTSTLCVGAIQAGNSEPVIMRLVDLFLYDRRLTPAEVQKHRDYARTRYGLNPITTTHRWSLRDVLRQANRRVLDGQLAPASLPDTVTAAAIDRMDRQGSPVVRVIDASVDGRKSFGAMGFTQSARFIAQTAGIRGAATGLTVAVRMRIDSIPAGTTKVVLDCYNAGSSGGFTVYGRSGHIALYVIGGPFFPDFIQLSTADIGRTIVAAITWIGTSWKTYRDGVAGAAMSGGMILNTDGAMWVGADRTGVAANVADWCSIFDIVGCDEPLSATEIAEMQARVAATGLLTLPAGKINPHQYNIREDILANGGPQNGIPAQVLDRIGTDHLTRVGGWKVDHGGLRSTEAVGVDDTKTVLRTVGSAFPGSTSPWSVEFVWYHAASTASQESFCAQATFTLTLGWRLYALPAEAIYVSVSTSTGAVSFGLTSSVIVGNHAAHLTYDGSQFRVYFDGVNVASSATGLVFQPAPAEPLLIGGHRASAPVYGLKTKSALGLTVYSGLWSAAEIATAASASIAAGESVGVPGKIEKQWSVADDIAEAGGNVPAIIKERVSGVDHMVTVGAPLQVASRTERLWSYETQPILYGAAG